MMLQAQRYVGTQTWSPVAGHVVTTGEAGALELALAEDARSLFASAAFTFVDALRGIEQKFYSWSTVKLYYSVFYALRSLLAANNFSIVYQGMKPHRIHARSGSVCTKTKGTTHHGVIDLFSTELPNHWLLSQEIDFEPPPKWLMHLREKANYTQAHFWEPDCPPHLRWVESVGIRRALSSYLDDQNLFTFDPDHAALAYPLQALLHARSLVPGLSEEDEEFIRPRIADRHGPLAEVLRRVF
jgi:hypothetical protein